MTTQALNNLAQARANLTAVAERAEQAHAAQSKLLVRRSEAESLAAAAFSDFRTGKLSEEVAALRKASAEADANDLKVLIDQGAVVLVQLNADLAAAQAVERKADSAARSEEDAATASTLTSHIDNLKKLHTEAVDERHQFHRKMGLSKAAMELLKHIRALESELLQAVAKCYDIHIEMEPPRSSPASKRMSSVHDFYKPSIELQNVVRSGVKPRI